VDSRDYHLVSAQGLEDSYDACDENVEREIVARKGWRRYIRSQMKTSLACLLEGYLVITQTRIQSTCERKSLAEFKSYESTTTLLFNNWNISRSLSRRREEIGCASRKCGGGERIFEEQFMKFLLYRRRHVYYASIKPQKPCFYATYSSMLNHQSLQSPFAT